MCRAISWDEADAECEKRRGHLLSLHDSHGYHRLQKHDRGNSQLMFIGLWKTVSKLEYMYIHNIVYDLNGKILF